jgi:peptidyl-prolyl cis-trans isomerase C
MVRRIALVTVAAALAACGNSGPKKSGPAVATGSGITITADEFKARLDEQSPFIRARYSTLERKKEFLDNLVRFEVLAKEAERQGLDKDPEVQLTLRKIMVQKLVQKSFQDPGAKELPEPELQKYYDEHKDEFNRPRKARLAAIILNAPAGSPDRAKKVATARKALAKVKAEEKKNPAAFQQAVAEFTDDAASKGVSGDVGFKSAEELEKSFGKEVAQAAFALKAGETSGLIEGAQGVYVLRLAGVQEELSRPFDSVKGQISQKLNREKRTKEFDDLVKKLREEAKVTVDEKALEAIAVTAPPPGGPGMPGMPGMPPQAPPAAPPAAKEWSAPDRSASRPWSPSRLPHAAAVGVARPGWPRPVLIRWRW